MLKRVRDAMRDDTKAIAEDIAASIACQWRDCGTFLESQGIPPLPQAVSGTILVTRAKIKPLSPRERRAAERVLAEGFPETPLALCKAIWDIEIEPSFVEEKQGLHRDRAFSIMATVLAKQGMATTSVAQAKASSSNVAFCETPETPTESNRPVDELPRAPMRSDGEAEFLRERVAYAEELAHDLWVGSCHLTAMPTQARHSLSVAVLAIATAQVQNIKSSELIDFSAEHVRDTQFNDFIRRPDVRKGLRSLVADARAAAQAADARAMASLVQTALLLPLGGPSRLPPDIAESVVACAAQIVSQTAAFGFLLPRAKLLPRSSSSLTAATAPSQGQVADFLLDSQRALFGEPTSRPMSGLVKIIMGIIGFIAFVGLVNALNTTCSHILH